MFEYAISAGEGTLIDYGVATIDEIIAMSILADKTGGPYPDVKRCDDDCETGK